MKIELTPDSAEQVLEDAERLQNLQRPGQTSSRAGQAPSRPGQAPSRPAEALPAHAGTSGAQHGPHEDLTRAGQSLATPSVGSRRIGEILCSLGAMNADQVQKVLEHQHTHGKLFGEIAIALGYVRREDVISALAQQFSFPYAASRADVQLHEELVMANAPFSDEVECFRNLRSDLLMGVLSPAAATRSALAIVSPEIGDGKTFVLANLAVAFSQARGRTLVIDADMRSPRLHEVFGIPNKTGLSNILSGRTETQVIQPVAYLPNLYMLPAGTLPPNPTELIHQPAFEIVLHELASKFDVVLVDTPAASHGSDASVVAARCGAALVVARKDASRVNALQALLARLGKSNVRLAGVMMNNV